MTLGTSCLEDVQIDSFWNWSQSRRNWGSPVKVARTLWSIQHVSILRTASFGNKWASTPLGKRNEHDRVEERWGSAIVRFVQCHIEILHLLELYKGKGLYMTRLGGFRQQTLEPTESTQLSKLSKCCRWQSQRTWTSAPIQRQES